MLNEDKHEKAYGEMLEEGNAKSLESDLIFAFKRNIISNDLDTDLRKIFQDTTPDEFDVESVVSDAQDEVISLINSKIKGIVKKVMKNNKRK